MTPEQRAKQRAEYGHAQAALSRYADRTYLLKAAHTGPGEADAYFTGIDGTQTGKAARFSHDVDEAAVFNRRMADWWQTALDVRYGVHVWAVLHSAPALTHEPADFDPREAMEAEGDLAAGQAVGRG